MFFVRRRILSSLRLTSSSNAAVSPFLAPATNKCSSSRATDDGRRCGLGALKVSKRLKNRAVSPFSVMNIALNIVPPVSPLGLDEGESRLDSKMTVCSKKLELGDGSPPGSKHLGHGPSLSDASTRSKRGIPVEYFAQRPEAMRGDLVPERLKEA